MDEHAAGLVVRTHVRTYHHIGEAVWGVHGHYVVPLEATPAGWRIAGITLRMIHQEGDAGLPAQAGERAARSPRAARQHQVR